MKPDPDFVWLVLIAFALTAMLLYHVSGGGPSDPDCPT